MRNAVLATKPCNERSRYPLAALLIVVMSSASVEAGIISFLGDVDIIAPPPSVVLGALEDDQLTRVFLEQSALILGSDVDADVMSPGAVDEAVDLTPGTIFSGTRVDSYLLHFDPLSDSGASSGGSVTFNRDILGILVQTSSLDATDALLGALATTYQLNDFRGVEGLGFAAEGVTVNDVVTLSADFRTIGFDFSTTSRIDEIRVITAVPEPAALGFIFVGVVNLLVDRRKRSAL
ncbi:MAG: hypothetical protein BMS9Abin37_2343 [Acidobacteriota bacterium]|nr:MAG: hypothetical protein BMS9Abin37_2343 [Acidobacteriota bacterium]